MLTKYEKHTEKDIHISQNTPKDNVATLTASFAKRMTFIFSRKKALNLQGKLLILSLAHLKL